MATAAGVSKMTASRALRGAADVSEENVNKVRQTAQQIGYVGNPLASSLAGQQAPLVGVVVPTLTNTVFAEVVTGIAQALDGTGIQPFFGVTDYLVKKEFDVVRAMLAWNPVGLIVTGLDQSDDTRMLLQGADIPIVQVMDLDGTPIDGCVGFSHTEAGASIAAALIDAGCRRFGFVGCGLDRDTRAAKRLAGFEAELQKHGLGLVDKQTDNGLTSINKGRTLTSELLQRQQSLDCIYFPNDDMATGGALHCIAAGIDVGINLTLVGFNGLEILDSLPVPVCTSHTPRREIGEAAVAMLMQRRSSGSKGKPITKRFVPSITLNRHT